MTMRKNKRKPKRSYAERLKERNFELWVESLNEGERLEAVNLVLGFQQAIFSMRSYVQAQMVNHFVRVDQQDQVKQAQDTVLRLKVIAERLGELGWPDYEEFSTSWDQEMAELVVLL